MNRNYRKVFLRWKGGKEAKGYKFFERLSDVVKTGRELVVGDRVMFKNNYGVIFGPYEVLGFCKPESWGGCVYFDNDAYWFPHNPEQLTLVRKGGRYA